MHKKLLSKKRDEIFYCLQRDMMKQAVEKTQRKMKGKKNAQQLKYKTIFLAGNSRRYLYCK